MQRFSNVLLFDISNGNVMTNVLFSEQTIDDRIRLTTNHNIDRRINMSGILPEIELKLKATRF